MVANAYWLVIGNEVWYSLHFTLVSLFFNTIFSLFVLILLNFLVKKFLPNFALSQRELLVIYVMLVMLSTVVEYTMIGYLMAMLAHPFWFTTVENEWRELFWKYIPKWLTVRDMSVLSGYFNGESSIYITKYAKGWLQTIAVWSVFIFVLWCVLICINVVIRKQWTEREKLSYPIIQLPLEMTNDKSGFFRSRMMWIGFMVAGGIDIINGLNFLFPQIPQIPVGGREIGHYFTEKPWNAIGWTSLSFYPFVIGLTFFVPLDLSFSCWFFHLFAKAEQILASVLGIRAIPSAPYINEQAAGAWLCLGIIAFWPARKHVIQVLRKAFSSKYELDDSHEPMRYRTALLGIVIGVTFLVFFCYQAKMTFLAISIFLLIYLVMAIGVARVRAEVGPPVHGMVFVNPRQIMVATMGTRRLGGANLTMLSFLYAFNRCNRAHPMPNQLEAFKIAERANIDSRKLLLTMLIAIAMGTLISFWAHLDILYRYGATSKAVGYIVGIGQESFNPLHGWLNNPRNVDYPAAGAIGFGAIFAFFLMFMRRRFVWWSLHPAGYALGLNTWGGIVYIWSAVFIGWLIKRTILKHGGLRAYRTAAPFFFGLILGEYVIACIWCLIGVVFNMPVIRVWVS